MLQDFSEKVISSENAIASASGGEMLSLRQFLGFERDYAHLGHLQLPQIAPQGRDGDLVRSFSTIKSLSAKNKSTLALLLLAYRTVDIAAALECHSDILFRCEKTSYFGTKIQVVLPSLYGKLSAF